MAWLDTPLTFEEIYIGEPLVLLALVLFVLWPLILLSGWREERKRKKRRAQKDAFWAKMGDSKDRK